MENAPQLSLHPETEYTVPAQYAYNVNWLAINELLTDKICIAGVAGRDGGSGERVGVDPY